MSPNMDHISHHICRKERDRSAIWADEIGQIQRCAPARLTLLDVEERPLTIARRPTFWPCVLLGGGKFRLSRKHIQEG